DGLIEGVFVIRGSKRACDGAALGVANVLGDLVAQRSLAETGEPLTQRVQVAAGAGVLSAKGVDVAEQALIDERGQAVEFEQRVLQGRCGEQQLPAVLRRPTDALADLVA